MKMMYYVKLSLAFILTKAPKTQYNHILIREKGREKEPYIECKSEREKLIR